MPTYRIENTRSGIIFGDYQANSEADALDIMAQDAGYRDYAAACCAVDPCQPTGATMDTSEIVATKIA